MRSASLLAIGLSLLVAGCASVPKTVTYQAVQWREVEEAQPPLQKIVWDTLPPVEQEAAVAVSSKAIVVQADIPREFPRAKKGRKYLNVGFNPVNPNRQLAGEEMECILPGDRYVVTIDRDNKRSVGWLLAGERVICAPTSNPDYYKAVWIRRCGNPILNEEAKAIFIRVERKTVPQASLAASRPKAALVPRVETVPQPPIKRWVQVPVTMTRELTCKERKAEVSWWRKGLSYIVTGAGGVAGAVIGGKVGGRDGIKVGAGIGVFAGRLIGGYTDGSECIDAGDVTEGVVLGVTAGLIAPTNARPVSVPPQNGGHTLPPNTGPPYYTQPTNPVTGHTLPNNGPPVAPTLPVNGGGFTPPVNPVTGHMLPISGPSIGATLPMSGPSLPAVGLGAGGRVLPGS